MLNPSGIWYTPVSGIWRTVWIEPVAKRGHLGHQAHSQPGPEEHRRNRGGPKTATGDLVEVKILDKRTSSWLRRPDFRKPLRLGIAEPKTLEAPTRRSSTTWKCVAQAGQEYRRKTPFTACARSEPSATGGGILMTRATTTALFPVEFRSTRGWWPTDFLPTDGAAVPAF